MKFRLASIVFLGIVASWGAQADVRLVSVGGEGIKAIAPNLISLDLEVWAKTPTAQKTQMLAAEEMKRVLKALESFKIAKEDMQTEFFQFGPDVVWDQEKGRNRTVGFSSTQTLRVLLRQVDQAGRLVDAMTKGVGSQGKPEFGTNVARLQWDSTERKTKEGEALTIAVKDAQHKAEVMAKAAGIKLGKIYRLSHASNSESGPRPMLAKMAMAEAASPETTMTEGQIRIQVSVFVDYEIQ